MVQPDHPRLSIVKQCELASITSSSYYYQLSGESDINLELLRRNDDQHLETSFYGHRQRTRHLRREVYFVSLIKIGQLMGLSAIYQKPNTSIPNKQHKIYPYLLRGLVIDRPSQVWCAGISNIHMPRDFLNLVAIMDWASRKVLFLRLANTMEADFCAETLEEALQRYGQPDIFTTACSPVMNLFPSSSSTPISVFPWMARVAGWVTS